MCLTYHQLVPQARGHHPKTPNSSTNHAGLKMAESSPVGPLWGGNRGYRVMGPGSPSIMGEGPYSREKLKRTCVWIDA